MLKKIYNRFKTIFNYIISSASSFIIDIILFTIFLSFINNILIAGYLARAISSICNYLINKYFVFKTNDSNSKKNTLFGYFVLVIINITISNILVSLINKQSGINPSIIKVVIDCLIFISNYYIQKYIIFKNNKNIKIYNYIMPILSFVALFIHLDNKGIIWDYNFYDYLNMIITIFLLFFMYIKLFKYKDNKGINFLSILFSIFMIVGYSFNKSHSFILIHNSEIHILVTLIKFFGYYNLIKNIINYIYDFILHSSFKDKKNFFKDKINKHPFIISFIILLIVYGFYLLCFYPGIINYDNANQIKEVMGIHNRYLDSVIIINKNITLTNFNPILHTLLLGNLFKFGNIIGNVNLGLFFYTFLQMIVIITINAYSIKFLKDEKIKTGYILIVLLLYIILPYYPFYSITCVKDSYWTAFFMLYIIKLYQFMKYKYTFKDYIIFLISIALLVLFRNNGIVVVLCSLPFIILYNKKLLKKIFFITLFTIIFSISYVKIINIIGIPNTSPREVLSVPFQQTARYISDYPNDVYDNEKIIIDKILTYDTIASRYEYELSDKVKNEYNIYTTKKDINNYFKVWYKMFLRHPNSYINATISNNYGYFYPNLSSWYFYCNLNTKLKDAGFNYHYNGKIIERSVLIIEAIGFTKIPVLNLLVSCGFWTWLYMFLHLLLKQNKKSNLIPLLFPAYSMIIMCLIGPANAYFRYVYPYAATAPILIMITIKEIKSNIKNQ